MASGSADNSDHAMPRLTQAVKKELEFTFKGGIVTLFDQDVNERFGWRILLASRPHVVTADLVLLFARLIESFVEPLDDSDDVLALREENLERQRMADRWLVETKGQAVIEIPKSLADPLTRSPMSVGNPKAIAERIVHRKVASSVCSICQQAFTLGDRRYERICDEDVGVVHTYCKALLAAGNVVCCPVVVGLGTGRDFALGRACINTHCDVRQSGAAVREIIEQLIMPLDFVIERRSSKPKLRERAAQYVGTLGKRFLFDPIDIALDFAEFGFQTRLVDLGTVECADGRITITAQSNGSFGMSSLDVAVALHHLIVGQQYEFKYSGAGYTMRDIEGEIRGSAS